jgi:Lrp/AsnC family transcriptional regulator, leucine-responsive regulatory protein
MDHIDRDLIALLQQDATQSYVTLGQAVGLSTGAAHERVRKLRERGVIRRTTVDVDPVAVGHGVLAFVMIESNEWMGDGPTLDALEAIAEIEESHVIAGRASTMVKIRAEAPKGLQRTLRRIFEIDGVTRTETIMVLETTIDRPVNPHPTSDDGVA